jgi:hypothetical protein
METTGAAMVVFPFRLFLWEADDAVAKGRAHRDVMLPMWG